MVWIVAADGRERIGSHEAAARRAYGREQIVPCLHALIDQMRDQLGVGVGFHRASDARELGS